MAVRWSAAEGVAVRTADAQPEGERIFIHTASHIPLTHLRERRARAEEDARMTLSCGL